MTDAARSALRVELRDDVPFVATPTPRLTWTVETGEPGWVQASAELSDGRTLRVTLQQLLNL